MGLLNQIDNPQDLKRFNPKDLPILSKEIREFIKLIVFENGGHLASNLGVVELTIALHYVFDFLVDSLIFDVSHQCYTHKILTGRRKVFNTLRQLNGITGFTSKKESPYDMFTTGHAGTSISTALGISAAKRLRGDNSKTIVIIGDASIGTGMAFEALNHAGHIGENLIVILNDNEMSIAETVGSLSTYLAKVRLAPVYKDMKREFIHLIDKIPKSMRNLVRDKILFLTESVKRHIHEGHLFQELNFNYYGPFDGHDIPVLLKVFNTANDVKGPILLHILTEKGRGCNRAVSDPEKYHGISPSVIDKGGTTKVSFTDAFSNSLIELANKDERIVAITAAMPGGTGLSNFQKVFPDRYFDTGICEQHAIGLASGLSIMGQKVVCAIYSTFLQRAYDQVFQELCLNNINVVLVMDRAGVVGEDGATHSGVFDIAYLRTLPNIVLMSPKDGYELKEMLKFALRINYPVGIRFPRGYCSNAFKDMGFKPIELGKAELLREGDDLILIGYGTMTEICFEVANRLTEFNIESSVINPRFAKPLDKELIYELLDKEKPILLVEEHSIVGGFGSAVLEIANSIGKDTSNIHIIGIPDQFTDHGNREQLLSRLGLDVDGIISFVKSILSIEESVRV